jgi:hypothetical protein
MTAFSRVFLGRFAAGLILAACGAATASAQMPTTNHGALAFDAATAQSQSVTITPSPVAPFRVRMIGPGAASFHVLTSSAACTEAMLTGANCLLPANGAPVTLTISFTPTGGPAAASLDTLIAGGAGPFTPLVAISGNGPVPVPVADHGSLNFSGSSKPQTVKIKPAAGESYMLKLNGPGLSSFRVETDTATCTEASLLAGNCSMLDTDSPVTLTVSFLPTGDDVNASIDAVSPAGATTPVVALSGSGNQQPPDVDHGNLLFRNTERQTVKVTPAADVYTLKLSGAGANNYWVTSDMYSCTDQQLIGAGCRLPMAGKSVKTATLTIAPKSNKAGNASLVAVNAAGAAPIVVLAVQQPANGELDCGAQYSDCDLSAGVGFSLIGGLEQSYLSSEQDQTNGFIRAYAQVMNPIGNSHATFGPWGDIRDLGAPQTGANQNIVAAVSNPTGGITTSSLSSIGYSVDFLVGVALDYPALGKNGRFSWGPIIGAGATTPISSATTSAAYTVPALGTQECSQLQARFASAQAYSMGYSNQLIAGPTSTLTGACLVNSNANNLGTPTQVSTLAFTGENRSNFLEKWEAGVRTTYRTYTARNQTTCDPSNPCQRGVVDYTIGEDSAITRGQIRGLVAKIDGVQPLPFSGGFFYLFGSVALRFQKDIDYSPLILQSATLSTNSIPNPGIFVEPLMQPNKDFYRIGVGLSLDQIWTALKAK